MAAGEPGVQNAVSVELSCQEMGGLILRHTEGPDVVV
jgi:hypothetical protein